MIALLQSTMPETTQAAGETTVYLAPEQYETLVQTQLHTTQYIAAFLCAGLFLLAGIAMRSWAS